MPTRRYALQLIFSLLMLSVSALPQGWAQSLFWEEPRILVPTGARFPTAAAGGGLVAVVWQEFVPQTEGGGDVYLSAIVSRDARQWRTAARFAGPFPYQEREAPLYSLAVDPQGRIFVAIASGENKTTLISSADGGKSFTALSAVEAFSTSLAPSLFITSRGYLLLFITQESENFLALYYAVSRDGTAWSELRPFVQEGEPPIHFLPQHAVFNARDYVVFQTLKRGERLTYQLQAKLSSDGGYTWSGSQALAFGEAVDGKPQDADLFSNQRPYIASLDGRLGVVWERQFQTRAPQIYYMELDAQGRRVGEPEAVTEGLASAHFPRILRIRDKLYIFFFDNRKGEDHVFVAEKRGFRWLDRDLSSLAGSSFFAYAVDLNGKLYAFWENRTGRTSRLMLLQPDQSVETPALRAVNFDPQRESRQESVQVRWSIPRDSSGIAGFNYVWSQNPDEPVARREPRVLADTTMASLKADKDGTWYFRLAAQDYAGNWSEPVTISFSRDATPPGKPTLVQPPEDPEGYLDSNSFAIAWQPAEAGQEVTGYAYSLQYLGTGAPVSVPEKLELPAGVNTVGAGASYANLDNGFWAFAVAAVDRAGNRSEPATVVLKLNKYIPVTFISYVNLLKDPLGTVDLTIGGRGFAAEGLVNEVILDRDGRTPFDYLFSRDSGAFQVASDRLIRGLRLSDLEEGVYRVGVIHPVRGLALGAPVVRLESPGTVKFGDFSFVYKRPWQSARRMAYSITVSNLVVWLVVAFLLLLFLVSARKLGSLVQEGRLLRYEVLAVLRGEMPMIRKEERMEELRRKGAGLRLKFTALIMILVLITVMMVSFPLGLFMIGTQRITLVDALVQRVDVLLGSISSAAANNLPIQNTIELGLLPAQGKAMPEVAYVTITGMGVNDPTRFDYIWASNDAKIKDKSEGGGDPGASPGELRIKDELAPELETLAGEVNTAAREKLTVLSEQASTLGDEARQLALKSDAQSRQRLIDLQEELKQVNAAIAKELQGIRAVTGSYPALDRQKLLPFYTFYRPIVYRQGREDVYFRGVVRFGISTEKINAELADSQRNLIFRTGIIALAAAGLGLVGAIIMASITVNPIKKLAAGVAVIRDTEDKEKLKDHRIDVRTRDEIGTLANTVNQMTQALVKAAIASKDLTVGKEVQKMFLPLVKDDTGRKGTTAGEQDNHIEIFGYYEGAKGVSGDYFDYIKLADKYYAFIKCDVAGKGVPAALIMVEVATIFSTFFRNWTPQNPGLKIDQLAYLINDMLEERGFKGRFAALTLSILNAETGKIFFCNAGDTTLRLYRQAEGRMNEYKLPEAPAAGVFPSMLVQMQAGFKQVPYQLATGDTIFLYTDGIEEAKRHFRNERFELATCAEPDLADNQSHGGTHSKGSDNEEMGNPRIQEIINAVFNRRLYLLQKFHNPVPAEELAFDFSRCRGTVEEAVLAMVAVEKIFRLYPDPSAGRDDRVDVDKRIEAFLKEHFRQYDRYFSHPLEGEGEPDMTGYSHLKEDEQYDDLTILAVRKR